MDSFEHALETEVQRLNAEVERLTRERDAERKRADLIDGARDNAMRLYDEQVARAEQAERELTAARESADDWKTCAERELKRVEATEANRDEALDSHERAVAAYQQLERERLRLRTAFDEWKARADAAEADNAALRKVIAAVTADAPGRVARVLEEHKPIITADHPGAALLERLRAAEASARAWEEQYKQTERLRRSQGDRLDAAVAVVEAARHVLAPQPTVDIHIERLRAINDALAAYDATKEVE